MTRTFAEHVETIRQEEATTARLFNRAEDGRSVRSAIRAAGGRDPEFMRGLVEAAELIQRAYSGNRRAMLTMQEAMGTDDFPLYFGDIIDRQMTERYEQYAVSFPDFAKTRTVRDFRTANIYAIDGGEDILEEVPAQTEYPAASLSERRYQLSVVKYGRRIPFAWETFINDDLDAFRDIPDRLANAVRRSQEKLVAQQICDANGPHDTLYSGGNANIVTGNPALSIEGLQTGFAKLAAQTDADGLPILISAVVLVVPPALEVTARNILNATEIRALTSGGGTSAQGLVAANWMRNRVRLSVNPMIPVVSSSSLGSSSWFLFADPAGTRPAVYFANLRGHEEPEIFMKEPNQRRVGGGAVNPLDGDYDTDSIEYKVRATFGAAQGDPKMTVASEGDGS